MYTYTCTCTCAYAFAACPRQQLNSDPLLLTSCTLSGTMANINEKTLFDYVAPGMDVNLKIGSPGEVLLKKSSQLMKTAALHRLVRCARLDWKPLTQPWGGGSGGLGYMYVHENSVHLGVQTTVMSASFTQRQLCVCVPHRGSLMLTICSSMGLRQGISHSGRSWHSS